jgi:hypothetical protein
MSVTATTLEQADAIVARLTQHKESWLHVSIPDRHLYLQRCLEDVKAVAPEWAAAACRAKRYRTNGNVSWRRMVCRTSRNDGVSTIADNGSESKRATITRAAAFAKRAMGRAGLSRQCDRSFVVAWF